MKKEILVLIIISFFLVACPSPEPCDKYPFATKFDKISFFQNQDSLNFKPSNNIIFLQEYDSILYSSLGLKLYFEFSPYMCRKEFKPNVLTKFDIKCNSDYNTKYLKDSLINDIILVFCESNGADTLMTINNYINSQKLGYYSNTYLFLNVEPNSNHLNSFTITTRDSIGNEFTKKSKNIYIQTN